MAQSGTVELLMQKRRGLELKKRMMACVVAIAIVLPITPADAVQGPLPSTTPSSQLASVRHVGDQAFILPLATRFSDRRQPSSGRRAVFEVVRSAFVQPHPLHSNRPVWAAAPFAISGV